MKEASAQIGCSKQLGYLLYKEEKQRDELLVDRAAVAFSNGRVFRQYLIITGNRNELR